LSVVRVGGDGPATAAVDAAPGSDPLGLLLGDTFVADSDRLVGVPPAAAHPVLASPGWRPWLQCPLLLERSAIFPSLCDDAGTVLDLRPGGPRRTYCRSIQPWSPGGSPAGRASSDGHLSNLVAAGGVCFCRGRRSERRPGPAWEESGWVSGVRGDCRAHGGCLAPRPDQWSSVSAAQLPAHGTRRVGAGLTDAPCLHAGCSALSGGANRCSGGGGLCEDGGRWPLLPDPPGGGMRCR